MGQNTLNHIAFVIDGNRRWAKQRGLEIVAGHRYAVENVLDTVVFYCLDKGIPFITLWALSTENWKRGPSFMDMYFGVIRQALKNNFQKYIDAGMKINTIGELSRLPQDIQDSLNKYKAESIHNTKMTVTLAINYGGRDEMLRAMKKLLKDALKNPEIIDNLNEETFSQYLDTKGLPDVDMIIRTGNDPKEGGNQRTSGYLLWQAPYAELVFTPTLFPDLNKEKLDTILEEFYTRERRFGK